MHTHTRNVKNWMANGENIDAYADLSCFFFRYSLFLMFIRQCILYIHLTRTPNTDQRTIQIQNPSIYEIKKKSSKKKLFTHSIFIHFQHAAGADVNNNNICMYTNERNMLRTFYDFHFECWIFPYFGFSVLLI